MAGGLLSIQPITSFASLIRVGALVERLLQSGNFPALTEFAKQAAASSGNNSSNNNKGNNNSDARYHKKATIACLDSPVELPPTENQPGSPQFASAPSFPHTTHTATIEPGHHVALARQGTKGKVTSPQGK